MQSFWRDGMSKFSLKEELLNQNTNPEPTKKSEKEQNPYIAAFIEERVDTERKESTIERDVYRLWVFLSFCEGLGKIPENMDKNRFKDFFSYLKNNRNCGYETRVRYYNLLKVFYRLLESSAFDKYNEYATENRIFSKKIKRKSYNDVNQEIMNTVITEIANSKSISRDRDGLMILVLWETGCRRSEVINLKYKDFNFENGQIQVTETKNDEYRDVVVTEKTAKMVEAYSSENICTGPEDFIFQNVKGKSGEHVKPAHVSQVFRRTVDKLVKKGKIDGGKRYVLHSIRHGRGVALLEMGLNIEIVMSYLGHKSVKTTLTYAHANERTRKMLPDIRKKILSN